MTTEPPVICTVCGEPADPQATAECNWCDRPFHLNQRNDVEGKDCGDVWIDEQYMALQFACASCLAGDVATSRSGRHDETAPRPAPAPRARRYRKRA